MKSNIIEDIDRIVKHFEKYSKHKDTMKTPFLDATFCFTPDFDMWLSEDEKEHVSRKEIYCVFTVKLNMTLWTFTNSITIYLHRLYRFLS